MGEVRMSGPLFDGRAKRVTRAMADEAGDEIAQQGVNDVRRIIQHSARLRTGNYERHVRADRSAGDRTVTDGGIVYGPWLEGVSRRNASSRFKGYAAFRRTGQALQAKAVRIAEPVVRRRIGGLQ